MKEQIKNEKEIIPCMCMTCGRRNDFKDPHGFCPEGHDAWLELRDVKARNEWFWESVQRTELTPEVFTGRFIYSNEDFEIKVPV